MAMRQARRTPSPDTPGPHSQPRHRTPSPDTAATMAMRQARRIAQDIAEANTLPKIRVSCMHERMDLLFAHIGLEDPRGCSLLRMPLLIQLNPDYPLSAPNVGFPVHFDYDMGATDHIKEGDLAGCLALCLNITGNFKEYHSEWATQKGEGWSPSMTLSSLLVQLQSLLLDIRVDKGLTKRIQGYTCQVDADNLHTHDSPFPAVSDVVQDVGSGSRAETSGTLARCYVTGSTEKDAVLGYGLSIAGRSLIVTTPAELLSWDAFQRDGVRLSAEKSEFTHFWPALPYLARSDERCAEEEARRREEEARVISDEEAKLYNFVQYAIQKLAAEAGELTDEDEEDNYQELVVWVRGFRNRLLTLGAACSGEMKRAIANTLISVWDLKTDQPGENLRAGGVVAVHKALEDLLSGPLEVARPSGTFAAIVATCTREASKALGCDASDGAAVLTSKLITGVVVEMMKGDKPDATRFFSALLDFRRVLRCLVNPLLLGPPCDQALQTGPNSANADLGQRLTARLRGFCDAEQARHKDACPNLGDMLSLYMCHPAACSREDFIAAYLDENFLRCVMWWRKDGVQPASRPVFEATRVSRSVCLFQLKILQLIEEEESKGALPTAVASRLDAFQKVTHTHMHTHKHTHTH
eukprot:Tamp_06494.p1 GENE.Tamp_06494~~Tamp_06494.p1  ORF type:complete len:699 (+),score=122.88 Tamp_06494:183-2099(+)